MDNLCSNTLKRNFQTLFLYKKTLRMDTIKQLEWRYATKKFDATKKLTQAKLNILTQAFNLTATSFGLQTIKLVIIQDKKIREQLVSASYNQKQVLEASHLFVICIQNDILESDVTNYYNNIKNIRKTSEKILQPFRDNLIKSMQSKTVAERQQWSKNQAYIALGNLMAVCAMESVDACPMEGFVPTTYNELLKLNDKGLQAVLLLPVGYRAEDDMFSTLKKVRKPLGEAVITL